MDPASTVTRPPAPASPSRRRVIFTGAAGLAALAIARWLQPTPAPDASSAGAPGLSADGADVMRALVPALLDGALPADRAARRAAIDETVAAVATAIEGLPPTTRHELDTLFALLAFAPARILIAGIDTNWRDATVGAANGFLERLRASRLAQKRAAYDALHQLAFAAWYANAARWPAIGYPGPPALG